jgi:hypothetical protein
MGPTEREIRELPQEEPTFARIGSRSSPPGRPSDPSRLATPTSISTASSRGARPIGPNHVNVTIELSDAEHERLFTSKP